MEEENFGERFSNYLKTIPLETRLYVSNQMSLVDFLTKAGFRENKVWTPEENELLLIIHEQAQFMTQMQLNDIKEWESNGRPEKPTHETPHP